MRISELIKALRLVGAHIGSLPSDRRAGWILFLLEEMDGYVDATEMQATLEQIRDGLDVRLRGLRW